MVAESDVREAMVRSVRHWGISPVDLGLIDSIVVDGPSVLIKIVPHCDCPFLPSVLEDMFEAANAVPGVEDVDIEVLWEVRWRPSMLTDDGRRCLGVPPRAR